MKKNILLSFVFLILFNCGDEIEFNTPAFQGFNNDVLWRATAFSASIDDSGVLIITGSRNGEKVELIMPTVSQGVYVLGSTNAIEARFTSLDGTVFSTNNEPHPNVSIYPELGEIRLNEILDNTFTGTFRFNAFDSSGLRVVNFTGRTNEFDPITGDQIFGGTFHRVPLVSGAIPANPTTCADKEAETAVALAAYQATSDSSLEFVSNTDYSAACSAYIDALNAQISFCGDANGAIQNIINDLGNCQISCEQATANKDEAESQFNAATIGNYFALCAQYQLYLQEQIDFCGDDDGTKQAAIDSLDCDDDDGDGIPNAFEDFNGDGDLTNDDTDIDGIPNYLDNDDDGDGILTANETVDNNGSPVDTDGDGDVDYLDNDDDDDGLFSNFETGDTDGNGIADYLDNDDDGDGVLTANESADPNMDGNPADAVDTDSDGTPDYLQA